MHNFGCILFRHIFIILIQFFYFQRQKPSNRAGTQAILASVLRELSSRCHQKWNTRQAFCVRRRNAELSDCAVVLVFVFCWYRCTEQRAIRTLNSAVRGARVRIVETVVHRSFRLCLRLANTFTAVFGATILFATLFFCLCLSLFPALCVRRSF